MTEENEETKNEPQPVPYDVFKAKNEENKALLAKISEYEAVNKKEKDDSLAEQSEWQKLAEQRKAEIAEKDTQITEERAKNLRLQVASEKGLPADLVDRLRGATQEEISKDADALLAHIVPIIPDGMPKTKKRPAKNEAKNVADMTPQEIRENSSSILSRE